jgi:hypothetical protein
MSGRGPGVAMKSPLVIVLVAVVLVTVGALAVMNKACKSSQHAWCAPIATVGHHLKTRRRDGGDLPPDGSNGRNGEALLDQGGGQEAVAK